MRSAVSRVATIIAITNIAPFAVRRFAFCPCLVSCLLSLSLLAGVCCLRVRRWFFRSFTLNHKYGGQKRWGSQRSQGTTVLPECLKASKLTSLHFSYSYSSFLTRRNEEESTDKLQRTRGVKIEDHRKMTSPSAFLLGLAF